MSLPSLLTVLTHPWATGIATVLLVLGVNFLHALGLAP